MNDNKFLEAALAYAELGYRVFPCAPGTKKPLTQNGFHDASADPAQIEAWWSTWPNANVAMPTEGMLVVDQDGRDNSWLRDSPERQADLAGAPMSLTPRGGNHRIMRQPPGKHWRCSTGKLAPHVDVRADGGYVVLPPSVTGDGVYRWQETMELDCPPDKLPEPPGWLAEMLDRLAARSDAADQDTSCSPGGNAIPSGQRNGTLARLAGAMRRVGMTEAEILSALIRVNEDRCQPPLSSLEVEHIAASIARYEPDQVSVAVIEDHYAQDFPTEPASRFVSALVLCEEFKTMCNPIIAGLLREGEIMNVIAAPKTGKSWLVLNLALSVATGRPWLDFPALPGRVLLIDNELHPETLANRIPRVADAMDLPLADVKDAFYVETLRGRLVDLYRMEPYFRSLPVGFFKVIILDAFYRFIPRDTDENDNGTMANLYNVLDRCAAHLKTGFVLVHHTTKGLQSEKSVTDVGAGAGSQSRAADCHFVMRPHEEDGCLSVDAVTRSWPSPESFVIRKEFPLWVLDPALDPKNLKKPGQGSRGRRDDDAGPPPAPRWTVESFVGRFVSAEPKSKAAVLAAANQEGLSDYLAGRLLSKAEARGLVHRWHLGGNRPGFATIPEEQGDGRG